jgi:hypothetical protein
MIEQKNIFFFLVWHLVIERSVIFLNTEGKMPYIIAFFLDVLIIILLLRTRIFIKIMHAIINTIICIIKTIVKHKRQISLFFVFSLPIIMSILLVVISEIFVLAPVATDYEKTIVERKILTELKTFFKDCILYSPIVLLVFISLFIIFSEKGHNNTIIEEEDKPNTDKIIFLLTRMNLSMFAAYLVIFLTPIFLYINTKYHLFDIKIVDLIINFSFSEMIAENEEITLRILFIIFVLIPVYFIGIFTLPCDCMREAIDYYYKIFEPDFSALEHSKYYIYFDFPIINTLDLFKINRKIRKYIKYIQSQKTVKYETKNFGEISAGSENIFSDITLEYDNKEIKIGFSPSLLVSIDEDRLKYCLTIIDRYFEIFEMTKKAFIKTDSFNLIFKLKSEIEKSDNIDIEKILDEFKYPRLYFDIKNDKEIFMLTKYNRYTSFRVEIDSNGVMKLADTGL